MVIFSDVHGHWTPLQELLEREAGQPMLCAGDVLGSGGGMNEALHALRTLGVRCAAGNHEVDFLEFLYRPILDPGLIEWIQSWPYWIDSDDLRVTHTLLVPSRAAYAYCQVNRPEEALEVLEGHSARVVFIGHRHLPGWWEIRDDIAVWTSCTETDDVYLKDGYRYVVDVGSVGENPARQDPSYVRYDGTTVSFQRLSSYTRTVY